MRVLVVGAGAVGSWLAAHLVLGGAETTLVARGDRLTALAREGLTARGADRTFTAQPALADGIPRAAVGQPFDWALVAVKSYHTAQVAQELAEAGCRARVASFQNGVGNEAVLAAALPDSPVLPATLTTGLTLSPAGTLVTGAARGGLGLGAGHVADDLAEGLDRAGLDVRRYRDPVAMKWSKLLLNLLGVASAAALGWPPERVFRDRRLFHLERAAWREALAVMAAAGQAPVALPGYPVDWYARALRWLPEAPLFRLASERLARGREGRAPGITADLAAGRTETEVSVLHGAVAAEGARLGVATPVCSAFTRLLADLAAGRRPPAALAGQPAALIASIEAGGS